MKKFGYFCLCFVPFLLAYVFEYAASFFMMGMSAVFAIPTTPAGTNPMSVLYEIWMDTNFNMVIMMIFSLSCTCTFGLWYYHLCEGELLPNAKTTFHPMIFAAVAVLVPGTQYASGLLTSILAEIFPSWMEAYEDLLDNSGLTNNLTLFIICYSVILAPISEELIFRGVIMRYARLAFPFWLANIFQAVLFGIFHGNMIQGCYAAALGLVLGYVCERGGSIYFSILLHILFNFWGTVISELLYRLNISDTLYSVLILVTMIASLAIGFLLFHIGCEKKAERNARLGKLAL